MPYDLVDPIADVDWVLMSGSMWVGESQDNVFLARHRVLGARADAVFDALLQRLSGAVVDIGVPGTRAISGTVDGAERVFLEPAAGVLAITPTAEAARAGALLRATRVPESVRPTELLRLKYAGRRGTMMGWLPREITQVRVWIDATSGKTTANLEGDCATIEDASIAVKHVHEDMRRASKDLVRRMLIGSFLERLTIWQDAAIVRMTIELDARDLELAAVAVCLGHGEPCPD
jgi:hypothetical protein